MQRDLVERAMARDHDAFDELARISIGRLYVVARLILRDEAKAEDATQEALVAAWTHIAGLRDPDRFDAWLHRLLVRSCYREAGRSKRRREHRRSTFGTWRPPSPTRASISPTAIRSSAASAASTPISGRSSCCTTTSA